MIKSKSNGKMEQENNKKMLEQIMQENEITGTGKEK